MNTKTKTQFEYSAGGIVRDQTNLLMIHVKNLEGRTIWTFPKGHIEKAEKPDEAAIREVREETGYDCQIIKPFDRIQYWFKKNDQLIKKTVTWYLMKAGEKVGEFDPEEILETRWIPFAEALTLAEYKSDKKLLSKLKSEMEKEKAL